MKKLLLSFLIIVVFAPAIFYSCKKEYSCEGCINDNKPPISLAGPDQVITLPADSILLDGSASSDPDGTISEWLWTKISGPAFFNIVRSPDPITKVKALVVGTYLFELKVTDNKGVSAKDTMMVTVDVTPTTNHPPIANAGADQTITLPTNSITVDGSSSTDPDNNITIYQWTKISGPSSFNIANANTVQTQITNLVQGVYQFELKVTDAGGLQAKDTMQITVQPSMPDFGNSNVYVAGAVLNGNIYDKAIIMKNGVAQNLTSGQVYIGFANAVFVSGNDVYVVGSEKATAGTPSVAMLWKNGVAQNLTDGQSNAGAMSVFVSGSDVYVAENGPNGDGTKQVAKLWKNGVGQNLTDGDYAASVFVSAGDVYVAGGGGDTNSNGTHVEVAKLWKNGIAQNLSDGTKGYSRAWSEYASGSDVYVAGTETDGNQYSYSDDDGTHYGNYAVAKLWKNGIAQNLSDGAYDTNASSVFVSGSDVYVAGYEVINHKVFAILWKNGVKQYLSNNGTNNQAPWCVYVSGSDVYVVGDEYNADKGVQLGKLWKNGVAYTLAGLSTARSVFVK